MNTLILISLFFISSCSQVKFDFKGHPSSGAIKIIKAPNKPFWIGRSINEVMVHKHFALMEMDKREGAEGSKVLIFKNSGGFVSSSSCMYGEFGGGCRGQGGEVVCRHVFSITENKVSDYDRAGACGDEEVRFRPLDKENNPLLSPEEQAHLQRSIAEEGPVSCKETADCLNGKSCSKGLCLHRGIWGKLFN